MGKRIETGFQKLDDNYTIDIYDDNYSGSAFEMQVGAEAFKLSYKTDGDDINAPIFSSTCTVNLVVTTAAATAGFNSFLTDLASAPEGQFTIVINKNGSRWWVGKVLTDLVTYEDIRKPYNFNLRATDGIGKLKDVDYADSGSEYTGFASLLQHIHNCIDKIGVTSFHSTGFMYYDACYWQENSHDQVAITGEDSRVRLLQDTRVDHKAFRTVKANGDIEFMNCYEVLETILKALFARILYVDGSYYIIQVGNYENDSIRVFGFEDDLTEASLSALLTINEELDTDLRRQAGGSVSFLPALNQVRVNYKHFGTRNYSEGVFFDHSTSTNFTKGTIDDNSNNATLLVDIIMQYGVQWNSATAVEDTFVKVKYQIVIGTYYLKREATISSEGNVSYSAIEWTTTASYFEVVSPLRSNLAFVKTNGRLQVNELTPELEESGTLVCNYPVVEIYKANGTQIDPLPAELNLTWSTSRFYIEVVINGNIEDRFDTSIFRVRNDISGNTKELEFDTFIGDGPHNQTFGKMQVFNGSNWEDSSAWRVGASGNAIRATQRLAFDLMRLHTKPIRRVSGTVISRSYLPIKKVKRNDWDLVPMRLSYNPNIDAWRGEWFDVTPETGITEQTIEDTLEIEKQEIAPSYLPAPDQTNTGTGQNTPFVEELINQVLPYKTGGGGILQGNTVTSIDTDLAITGEDFITGDIIILINPATAEKQEFTVSANTSNTDTSISVTSQSASYDFPAGSRIVRKDATERQKGNSSIAARLGNEDYVVDANYHTFDIANLDGFNVQVRSATPSDGVGTINAMKEEILIISQHSGNTLTIEVDGSESIKLEFDSGTVTKLEIKDGQYVFNNVPNYANDAAATADSNLDSGSIYTVTSEDKTLRIK